MGNNMISAYDIAAIVFYFLFMLGLALTFRKQISNTSDYFRGGGKMLWWMCGASAFMTTFSAWTFSGAAGKAYEDGLVVGFIFIFNVLGYILCSMFFAARFRQLRVITPIQAIRMRFGRTSEQVYTWFRVLSGMTTAAVSLIAVSVFMSAILGFDQTTCIILTGAVIVFMTVIGGSWAVIASDFLQCLLIIAISIVTFIYTYDASGGIMEVAKNFPAESFVMGNGINYTEIFLLWVLAIFIQRMIGINSMDQSVRFLSAKDSSHARKAAILAGFLFFFGCILWFFPPMYAAIAYPDLASTYPTLKNPSNGAYLVVVQNLLPSGMIGLVVAAMFSAAMSSLDSQINNCSGTIVKNFYVAVINPDAEEHKQLLVSRMVTIFFGACIICLALFFNQLKGISLFELMIVALALVNMPMMVPQIFGLFVRRAPDWAAWGTLSFGVFISIAGTYLVPASFWAELFDIEFTRREYKDLALIIPQLMHGVFTIGFFWLTTLFYKEPTGERKKEVDMFWNNVTTPLVAPEGASKEDNMQRFRLGIMAMIFGTFVIGMGFLPNEGSTSAFFMTGGFMLVVGFLLRQSSKLKTEGEIKSSLNPDNYNL